LSNGSGFLGEGSRESTCLPADRNSEGQAAGYMWRLMNRIDKKFKELKRQKKKAFIAYICAGDPDIATTEKLVLALECNGVDVIELGMPFSDPLADGPTIQMASQRALKNRVNIPKMFSSIRRLRKNTEIPIILMGYYNPIYNYGIMHFIKEAKKSGIDGVIIPDLIPEEADDFILVARQYDFSTIFLASPTSTNKRLKLIAAKSSGFIYYVSLTGVTGTRQKLSLRIKGHIARIKRISNKPVCIGFGVSTPEQVRTLVGFSDGVIIGSAIIKRIEKNLNNKAKAIREASSFIRQCRKGLD
jgi:tryptophan synthase alpha chain